MTNDNKRRRYYYAKVSEQFINSNEITYLVNHSVLGLKAYYLFTKLIIKAANDDGRLLYKLGDKELDYSADLIAKDITGLGGAKTIDKCLRLLDQCGLIKRENGFYIIVNFNLFVGSETGSAQDVRRAREQFTRLDELMDTERLEAADKSEKAAAEKIAEQLWDIRVIRNMTDTEPYELALNGFLGLILEYGQKMTNDALEYVLNVATERNADGHVTKFKFKQVSNKSQVQYLLNATSKQCEQKREIQIKSGIY